MNDRKDTSQWLRLRALFDQAIDLDGAQQAQLLRMVEREDAELAQMLAPLVAADAWHEAHTFEHRGNVLKESLDVFEAPGVAVGDRVGPYILRERLGYGGMGVVFRAERVDGQVRQEVALKIVRRALLDGKGRERFLREREIVAGFQHPYIARMLDVGQTPDGSPYLAMELIRGQAITDYCDARRLDARARIGVFLRVCEAVQHAHANLVLHRDLKPSNVLVGADGLPKLIDFGIARPLGILAGDEHPHTAEQRFFSPSNVAPEQLRGERVGVACDVYQLGTLLHELLCSATVFDGAKLTPGQLEQKILDVAPEAPSARALRVDEMTAQAHGALKPVVLARGLRGDLDAIVALALRKLPGERYGSVEQFADDLRRYLDGRPAMALRGRRWYRARKFLRRHALAVAASTAALALVCAFVTALWIQSQRIARERDLAQQRANEVEQVARFEAGMLKQMDPTRAGKLLTEEMRARFSAALVRAGVPTAQRAAQAASFAGQWERVNATDTARALIDRTTLKPAIAAIDKQFGNQPVVAATLRQVLADRYVEMGLYDAAMPLQQNALAARRRILGEEHPQTLQSISDMGELLEAEGRLDEAEPYLREALAGRRRVLGEEHADTVESIGSMGDHLFDEGKLGEADPYFREALDRSRRVNGEQSKETLRLLDGIGNLLLKQGKPGEAEPYLREALGKSRRVLGEDDPQTVLIIGDVGWMLRVQGKLSEAEPYLRDALERSRRVLGEEHPHTLDQIDTLGILLDAQGKPGEAERYFNESLEKRRRVMGEENPLTLSAINNMGRVLLVQGKSSAAEPFLHEALDKSRRALGEQNPTTLYAISAMGDFLQDQGKLIDAEPFLREAMDSSRRALGEEDPATLRAVGAMGNLLQEQGRLALAEPYLTEAWEKSRRVLGEKSADAVYATSQLGALLVAQREFAEAEKLLVPVEAETRDIANLHIVYPRALIIPRALILMSLGEARTGLGEFAAAETDLLGAQPELIEADNMPRREKQKHMQAFVDLYTAWNIAEPRKGHDAKALEWKRQLDRLAGPQRTVVMH